MALDGRTYAGFRKFKTKDHGNTVSSTLQFRLSKRNNNRRKHKRLRGNLSAGTTERNTKTHQFCKSLPIRHRKKIRHQRARITGSSLGLEHFRLYIYGKPMKLLTDHQALEPLIKRNRSNKTYSARLTRWLDRLAHFTINVNHIAGKHLALTDYLSRNPVLPPQADDTYDEEYVINNIIPHYSFISKYGCLSNHTSQSENGTAKSERKSNNEPLTNDTRKQTAIDCLYSDVHTRSNSNKPNNSKHTTLTMDAKTIENIEARFKSAEITELTTRWKEIVKPGIYRMTGGRWKRYHEPKFFRNERKVIEERLQQLTSNQQPKDLRQIIGPQHKGGYQPQTGHSEQWTVDPFWEMD